MNQQTKFVIDKLVEHKIKSVLNIGYRFDSDRTVQTFMESQNKEFYILEAWKENCVELIKRNITKHIYHGDCKNIEKLDRQFDAIIWLHGPEHMIWDDFLKIREKIEAKADKLIIYQAPIGAYPQDSIYGNPYEKHLQTIWPGMFERYGYKVTLQNTHGENTVSAYIEK